MNPTLEGCRALVFAIDLVLATAESEYHLAIAAYDAVILDLGCGRPHPCFAQHVANARC
jgi:hypothetical protein